MEISFNNSNDKNYQKQLNALLKPIFLDFQFWYDLDLWDKNYESYSIIQNDKILSNISVFKADILMNWKQYRALSVGAVATRPDCRGHGYSRLLMEHIISRYPDTPMYLSANDKVVDFYPRFGFKRIYEKLPVSHYKINNTIRPNKLPFDSPIILNYLHNRVNFSQKLDCLNTSSINMFHIHLGHLKEHIYHIPGLETILIAKQKGSTLKIIGVFSLKHISFLDFARHLPFAGVEKIEFGFMPCWDDLDYKMTECEADPFFTRGVKCNLGDFKFPELSIT